MKRGTVVTVAGAGEYGKPRPAVVVQHEELSKAGLSSVVLCLISSHGVEGVDFRIRVEPSDENGLRKPSDIMVDKILTVSRDRIGASVGQLDDAILLRLNRALAFVLGLG